MQQTAEDFHGPRIYRFEVWWCKVLLFDTPGFFSLTCIKMLPKPQKSAGDRRDHLQWPYSEGVCPTADQCIRQSVRWGDIPKKGFKVRSIGSYVCIVANHRWSSYLARRLADEKLCCWSCRRLMRHSLVPSLLISMFNAHMEILFGHVLYEADDATNDEIIWQNCVNHT